MSAIVIISAFVIYRVAQKARTRCFVLFLSINHVLIIGATVPVVQKVVEIKQDVQCVRHDLLLHDLIN